jgi:hypothetical protein
MKKLESATGIAPVLSVRETVVLLLDDADEKGTSATELLAVSSARQSS